MRTYQHRQSQMALPGKSRKQGQQITHSRRARRISIFVASLILFIDVITARYFPQIQAALTLSPLANQSNPGGAVQLPFMKNAATATSAHGTPTIAMHAPMPKATVTPTTTTLALDNFARPDQSLWGTASDGLAWSADAARSPAFSIINHTGLVSRGSGIYDAILGPRSVDSEVLVSGTVSRFSNSTMGVLLRWNGANNLYKIFIDGSNLTVFKLVNGVLTVLQSVPFTARDGVSYTIRARIIDMNIMARVWQTGQDEPSTWMLSTSDGDISSGYDGLRLIIQSGISIGVTSFLELQA